MTPNPETKNIKKTVDTVAVNPAENVAVIAAAERKGAEASADSLLDPKKTVEEDTANDLTAEKPLSKSDRLSLEIEKLPEGKMKDACKEIHKQLKENPGSRGMLSEGMLTLLILAAKSQKYMDVIPGNYVKRVNKIDKKMEEEELKALMRMKREQEREKELTESQIKEYGPDADMASTKYVCDMLWHGNIKAENSDELSAKLLNTQTEDEKAYYEPATGHELKKKGMPYGTILIIRASIKDPVNIAAFATGEKDEFRYFDSKEKKVITLLLKDTQFKIISGLVPKVNSDPEYFGTAPEEGKKKFAIDEKVDGSIHAELRKVTENDKKMEKEWKDFEKRLAADPTASSFNADYLFNKVKENEALFDRLVARAGEITPENRLLLIASVNTYQSLIETSLRCLEGILTTEEHGNDDPTVISKTEEKIDYLNNVSAKKLEEYTEKLKISE